MTLHFVKISGLLRFAKTYSGKCPSQMIIYTNLLFGGIPKKQKYWVSILCFFDRYEIRIQAFLLFINGNESFFNPHLHKKIRNASPKISIQIFLKKSCSFTGQRIKKSWFFEFWASKIMKYWFSHTKMKQTYQIKMLKI